MVLSVFEFNPHFIQPGAKNCRVPEISVLMLISSQMLSWNHVNALPMSQNLEGNEKLKLSQALIPYKIKFFYNNKESTHLEFGIGINYLK